MKTKRGTWSSWWDFFFSVVGCVVGLGNVWRFPYLCYKNGGGAFFLPYTFFLLVLGLPLLLLIMSYSQFCNRGPTRAWSCCPLFKGIGYGSVIFASFLSIYYNVILCWSLYYFGASFKAKLPWSSCDNAWNTPQCFERFGNGVDVNSTSSNTSFSINGTVRYNQDWNVTAITSNNEKRSAPSQEFWTLEVLQLSPGIEDIGGLRWELVICLACGWLAAFAFNVKGIKSAGKVVYVTATLPYVMMFVLLVRCALLPGALDGIRYLVVPRWEELGKVEIWVEAAAQAFISLNLVGGAMETLNSYSKFHNNVYRDTKLIILSDAFTSVLAGCVVFVALGFMAQTTGLGIDQVVSAGPGIAFMAYPEVLSQLPFPQIWSVFFFLMLFSLGVDSQIASIHVVTTAFFDLLPAISRKFEPIVLLVICSVGFLLGLPMVTQGGVYVLQIWDWYMTSVAVMFLVTAQCLGLAWLYGADNLYRDIEFMIGFKPPRIWQLFWKYVCPVITSLMFIYNIYTLTPIKYGDVEYPGWAIGIGWIIGVLPIVPFPVTMAYQIGKGRGSLLQRLKSSIMPDDTWGPALPQYSKEYRAIINGQSDV